MPNFIIPVVGNPAGGYFDGDQVTAANLNAHIQEAIPTPDFINSLPDGTGYSQDDPNDYYMKVDKDGYLVKVAATSVGSIPNTVTTLVVNTPLIKSPTPDNIFDQWESLYIQSGNQISIQSNYTGSPTNNYSSIIMTGNVSISTGIGDVYINSGTPTVVNGVNTWPKFNINRDVVIDTGNLKVRGGPYASDGGSGFIQIPRGPTSSRPNTQDIYPSYPLGSNVSGVMRFNTTTNDLEWVDTTQADNWNSVKRANSSATYVKQLTLPAFALNAVLWESPSEFVVPEGEVWIYELNYQFNSGNWGGNTRPEPVFDTKIFLGSIQKVHMVHFTGAYGGPLSAATATVVVTREDTYANGIAYPKKVSWKVTSVGRFGSFTEEPNAYGYIKLTKVKTAAQGTTPQL